MCTQGAPHIIYNCISPRISDATMMNHKPTVPRRRRGPLAHSSSAVLARPSDGKVAPLARSDSMNMSVGPSSSDSTIQQDIQLQEETDLAQMKSVCTLDAHCIRWMNKRKTGISNGTQNVKVGSSHCESVRIINVII